MDFVATQVSRTLLGRTAPGPASELRESGERTGADLRARQQFPAAAERRTARHLDARNQSHAYVRLQPARSPTKKTAPREACASLRSTKPPPIFCFRLAGSRSPTIPRTAIPEHSKSIVPDTFAVAGTGKADAPVMMPAIGRGQPGQASYVFHCDRTGARGFVRCRQPAAFARADGGLSDLCLHAARASRHRRALGSFACPHHELFLRHFWPAIEWRPESHHRADARWVARRLFGSRTAARQRTAMDRQAQRSHPFASRRRPVVGQPGAARYLRRRMGHRRTFSLFVAPCTPSSPMACPVCIPPSKSWPSAP